MTEISVKGPYEGPLEETVKAANGWLERLLGDAATEIGGVLGDTVRNWRARRAVDLVLDSMKRFHEREVLETRAVPPGILIPLLEAASLETDEQLHEWWVELLTNASDASRESVPVSFPRILAELSSREARIVDWIFKKGFHSDSLEEFRSTATFQEICEHVEKMNILEFKPIVANLCRLGLMEPEFLSPTTFGMIRSKQRYDQLTMGPLGASFVQACSSPQRERPLER